MKMLPKPTSSFLFVGLPNHWVDISDSIEQQLEALHCHTSQVYGTGIDEMVRQRARLIGVEHGYTHGESFHHLAMR